MFSLLGWLRKRRNAPGDIPTRAEFDALLARMEALDELQTARELHFVDLTTQLRRQLGRLAAYGQRDKQREDESGSETANLRELLRSKYPRINGGG